MQLAQLRVTHGSLRSIPGGGIWTRRCWKAEGAGGAGQGATRAGRAAGSMGSSREDKAGDLSLAGGYKEEHHRAALWPSTVFCSLLNAAIQPPMCSSQGLMQLISCAGRCHAGHIHIRT